MSSLKVPRVIFNSMIRVRVNFDKTESMRFIGHLDLYRAWERALRRAGVPLAYSQGFKPHPRIQIAAALPLGFTSSNDLLDIWLEEAIPLSQLQSQIQPVLPPGLRLNHLAEVPLQQPALQSLLVASEYEMIFLEYIPDLNQRIDELIHSSTIPFERKGKIYDLRSSILSLSLLPQNQDGYQYLRTVLHTNPSLHARPDELIRVMGILPEKALFHRLRLIFSG